MAKAVGYRRVSTREQPAGGALGLAAQQASIDGEAVRLQLPLCKRRTASRSEVAEIVPTIVPVSAPKQRLQSQQQPTRSIAEVEETEGFTRKIEDGPRGGFPFRHYVGRDQSGPWLLRFPQTSLSEEA